MKLRTHSEEGVLLMSEAHQAGIATAFCTAGSAVPAAWIGQTSPYARERTVLDFFQAQVRARPEALAIKDAARLITYAELDLLSNRVANALYRHTLKPEEPVLVLLPASFEFLAGVLGVLKAGGTYFPAEMDTPTRRLELLLSNSACRLVLTNEAGVNSLREWSGKVLDWAQVVRPSEAADRNPGVPADPNRRAYIICTSGSTGQPKAVEIEHHSLTNLVGNYHQQLRLTAQDRAAMLASVAFDASVADIWPVLSAGGSISIPPKGILLNPDGLIEWLAAEEITLTFVPTGLAEILFARPWPERMKLRVLITGGDRLRFRPPAGLPFEVINGYGPTENTVFSTWSVVTPASPAGQPPPIGRPLRNTTAYVLDENLQPQGVNAAGELYLGGEQVARGYLGASGERFLPDPFSGKPGARMYRTGDWVRWLADGELEFLQRLDGQIQIGGRRVELGEIEATVFGHGNVQQVCCVPRLNEGMPASIIAHVVPLSAAGLVSELRAHLSARLPVYMVPAEFVFHQRLPLTPQGKLDRATLTSMPLPTPVAPKMVDGEDGLTMALFHLWQSLLPAAKGSTADTSFASLGGDSLLAVRLMLRVQEITGQWLEVSDFLVNPTFGGLCEAVKMRQAGNKFEPLLALRKQGTRPAVFCLYTLSGDIECYFNLVEALGEDQPVYGIRSPALDDLSRLPASMEAAASEVVRSIRKIQPQGAVALVGYSWAGLLAFEAARQILNTEGIHCFTALIGTDAPLRPTNFLSRCTHLARHFPRWLWDTIADSRHRWRRLKRWRETLPALRDSLVQARWPLAGPSAIARHLTGLMENYQPLPAMDTTVFVFRERDEDYFSRPHPLHNWLNPQLPDAGWNAWTLHPNKIHWVAGDHSTILKRPAVSELAQSIRQTMDQHFKTVEPGN